MHDCIAVRSRILNLAFRFRDMTALLLSKLLTREEMHAEMQEVLQWCWSTLAASDKANAIGRYGVETAMML
jgi:hypothetical protein